MNTVTLTNRATGEAEKGSIWESQDGEIYILAQVSSNGYAAIGLDDGNRWGDIMPTMEEAVDGLKLVAFRADIAVTPRP